MAPFLSHMSQSVMQIVLMAGSHQRPAPLTSEVNMLAVLVAEDTHMQTLPFFFPSGASTHCAYQRRDGMARLSWPRWLVT